MDWRQWFYLIYIITLFVLLYGFWFYLYGSKKRREDIEKSKYILFSDDPIELNKDSSQSAP